MKKKDYTGRIDPSNENTATSPWIQLQRERYLLASKICEGKNVLDACCGTGKSTQEFIVPVASSVTGFDLCGNNPSPLSFNYITADALKIDLDKNSFDVVLALDSIEHFSEEEALSFLSNMKKVCKQNGIIFGTTPLVPCEELVPTFLAWNEYHIKMYTRNVLLKSLKKLFPKVEIFELFNATCAYLVFICSESADTDISDFRRKIEGFISADKTYFLKGKAVNYWRWSKKLLLSLHPFKAFYFFGKLITTLREMSTNENKCNS